MPAAAPAAARHSIGDALAVAARTGDESPRLRPPRLHQRDVGELPGGGGALVAAVLAVFLMRDGRPASWTPVRPRSRRRGVRRRRVGRRVRRTRVRGGEGCAGRVGRGRGGQPLTPGGTPHTCSRPLCTTFPWPGHWAFTCSNGLVTRGTRRRVTSEVPAEPSRHPQAPPRSAPPRPATPAAPRRRTPRATAAAVHRDIDGGHDPPTPLAHRHRDRAQPHLQLPVDQGVSLFPYAVQDGLQPSGSRRAGGQREQFGERARAGPPASPGPARWGTRAGGCRR